MTKLDGTTRMMRAVNLHEMPPEKWQDTIKRLVLGVLTIALAVWGITLDWPLWVSLPLVGFGGMMISRQLLVNTAMAALEPYKAWKRAMQDKDDA